mmetsp:Transcript_24322/g.54153  ORF Transcript_24322/g.54153 Transcript_24322/m.54153 type:complete len:622 (+) Transcript_24322:91-1956(+)
MASAAAPGPTGDVEGEPDSQPDHLQAVAAFVELWGLSTDAQEVLFGMSPEAQREVMIKFAPQNDKGVACKSRAELGRECEGKFIVFARGIAKSMQWKSQDFDSGAGPFADWAAEDPGLSSFVERWSLGPDAQQALTSLPPELQHEVISKFAPLNDLGQPCSNRAELGRECDGKLILFARGVAKGKGKGKHMGGFMGPAMAFADYWGYSAPNGMFWSEKQAPKANISPEAFVEKWGLGADAQRVFLSVDPAVQSEVMSKFSPKNDQGVPARNRSDLGRDVDGKLILFTRGVERSSKGKGKGGQDWSWGMPSWNMSSPMMGGAGWATGLPLWAQAQLAASEETGWDDVFGDPWGMGHGMQSALYGMGVDPYSMAYGSWGEGDAPKTSRKGQGRASSGAAEMASGGKGWAEGSEQATEGSGNALVDGFVKNWGLGPDAQRTLYNLSPEMQREVMSKFSPLSPGGVPCSSKEDLGRDCDGKFILFARGVEKGAKGMGKSKGFVDHGLAQMQNWLALKGAFKGAAKGGKKSSMAFGPCFKQDVGSFIETWALGPDAQSLLHSLDAYSQQEVMSKFSPRNELGQICSSAAELCRECDGKFIAFARSWVPGGPSGGFSGAFGGRFRPY